MFSHQFSLFAFVSGIRNQTSKPLKKLALRSTHIRAVLFILPLLQLQFNP